MYDPLKSKTKVVAYAAIAFLFGVGIASGFGWTARSQAMTPTTSEIPQIPESAVQPALDLSDAFVNVADHVTPAVVRIETERSVQVASRPGGNPLEQFFFERPGEGDEPQERLQAAGGSGFIISEDGHILTNDHVVGTAEAIRVFLADGRTYDAELVGADRTTDVAVIRILDGEGGFPTLSFGNSDELKVGEWILAVGNPGFGGGTSLEYTVTAGIISAKSRGLQLIANGLRGDPNLTTQTGGTFAIEDFIQTDAVINPGNSGGPMVNLRGQVVGINSAIASQTGYYQGYGFAIPIDLAERVSEDLIEYGIVRRAWIGISMNSVDALDAEKFNLPRIGGALVMSISDDSPAVGAGLRAEDVITAVNGEPIMRSSQLQQVIARKRPGDRVELEVYRNGRARSIDLRLAEAPLNAQPVAVEEEDAPEEATEDRLGINVRPLTEEINANLGYETAEGVIIWEVERYSAAARRNLARGQKIIRIDGEEINTVSDVSSALAAVEPGQIVTFVVGVPGGGTQVINVRVPR